MDTNPIFRPRLLLAVALLQDRPEKGLKRGQVGTVVGLLHDRALLTEFSDDSGRCYALEAVDSDLLLELHHEPAVAVA
ncbi:MAG: DUF4926 domain-containing protein [Bryobacterales bacterium]